MSRAQLAPMVNLIISGDDSPMLLQKTLLSSAAHSAKASLWAAEQGVGPGDLWGPFPLKLLQEST